MFSDSGPLRTLPYVEDDSRAKIMRCIEVWFARHNKAPTVREICQFTGLTSTDTVADHINMLVKEGFLTKTNDHGRNLRLTSKRYFF
jgi:SOS-response transcriptional repressor LexA